MGGTALESALRTGVVEFAAYRVEDLEQSIADFVRAIGARLVSGESYPLLDDATGALVRTAISEGFIEVGEAVGRSGRVMGVAADVLQRLPLLDEATVDEIWHIRQELARPLIDFRAAMSEYAGTIQAEQWDRDFEVEADQLFREKVEPAVVALEEEIAGNRLLAHIRERVPAAGGHGVFGAVVGALANMPPIVAASLGFGASVTNVMVGAFNDMRSRASRCRAISCTST